MKESDNQSNNLHPRKKPKH
uniref:Uncharacterized protein n=1 Tax=Rhizophora mucronata TaxID=61149 RepID=A0A2P2QFQ3_RHIMU